MALVDYRRVKKVRYDGFLFDSMLERDVYQALTLECLYGRLHNLRVKPRVSLTLAKIIVIPDFLVTSRGLGRDIYVEAKGLPTSVWKLKMRLWKCYGPGEMRVYKRSGRSIVLTETIQGASDTVPTQKKGTSP